MLRPRIPGIFDESPREMKGSDGTVMIDGEEAFNKDERSVFLLNKGRVFLHVDKESSSTGDGKFLTVLSNYPIRGKVNSNVLVNYMCKFHA